MRIARRKRYVERKQLVAAGRTHQLNFDVLSHSVHQFIGGKAGPLFGVQIELVDDMHQTRATENLLSYALQTVLQVVVYVRGHQIFGHCRLFNDDRGSRFVH